MVIYATIEEIEDEEGEKSKMKQYIRVGATSGQY